MRYYSTVGKASFTDFKTALLQGLAPDGGLYMPGSIPQLDPSFFKSLASLSFQDIAFIIGHRFAGDTIPQNVLRQIIERAFGFDSPVVSLSENTAVLELFHGPTLAFKDFGARFMAQCLSYFSQRFDQPLTILVATSGDTGGAVASAFEGMDNIRVVILFPSGKVSALQRKQLTTLKKNIIAVEVKGDFDDCQRLVKAAFNDPELRKTCNLTSANSINIGRLIPQSFYYFRAYAQVANYPDEILFSVPSGNFGNLTAGLFAREMGLPVSRFIAATNANRVVYDYLNTGKYAPLPSVKTLSTAMDVGNPSNLTRILTLYQHDLKTIRKVMTAFSITDQETIDTIVEMKSKYGYTLDPHGAVGWKSLTSYRLLTGDQKPAVVLETAHPAKFTEELGRLIPFKIELPESLKSLMNRKESAVLMENRYQHFKEWLCQLP